MAGSGLGLKVVRGREVGRVFPLSEGKTVLGNAAGDDVLDLSGQEIASPRRMSARQAEVELRLGNVTVRDLDSPGGTFVNRQRLLTGEARGLRVGDVIQLGAVQLEVAPCPVTESKVSARPGGTISQPSPARPSGPAAAGVPAFPAPTRPDEPNPPTSASAGPFSTPFRLASGTLCRTVEDFLTASAQNWPGLRDELASGRLSAFLQSQGRSDLVPRSDPKLPIDERLDSWIAALPTARPATYDIEVHPSVLKFRAVAGGGVARQKFVVTNTGYRLLRSALRVEPPHAEWLRIASGSLTTSEQTEVPVEVTIPENLEVALKATVLVESNGGTRRVEVRLEPPVAVDVLPEPAPDLESSTVLSLTDRFTPLSLQSRVIRGAIALGAMRALLVGGDGLVTRIGGTVSSPPSLTGSALIFLVVGGLAGAAWVLRRGSPRDLFQAAFAGGFGGLFLAAVAVAACQSVEPILGEGLGRSAVGVTALWAFLGGLAGWLSRWPWPPPKSEALAPGSAPT